MRIVRPDMTWRVLLTSGESICLHRLAIRRGYRVCDICEELGCGERYLYQAFTRDIGLPPKIWLRGERMVVARRMLTGGKDPQEVAAGLGFQSANNFRREFLAVHGVSPRDYQHRSWGHPPAPAAPVPGPADPISRRRKLLPTPT